MVIQSNLLPIIASPSLTPFNPLIIEPTLNVLELMTLLQRSQAETGFQFEHETAQPDLLVDENENASAVIGSPFVTSSSGATAAVIYALVMQGCQLLGIITYQEVNQVSKLNRCLSQILVCEIMRRPMSLPKGSMSRFFKVTSLMQQLWRQWLPKQSSCVPLLQETMQRQSNWYFQGHQLVAEIAQAAVSTAELQSMFDQTVQNVQCLLQADRACIYQYQEDGSALVRAEAVVSPYPQILNCQFQNLLISSQSAIESFRAGKYLNLIDIDQFPQAFPKSFHPPQAKSASLNEHRLPLLAGLQVKSKLAVPIRLASGNLWGLIVLHQCSTYRDWQETEISLLQSVALHLHTSIQYVQLLETVDQLQHDLERQKFQHQAHVKKLENARRLKDDFLSTVSHELKTPLATMKTVTNLLRLSWQNQVNSSPSADGQISQYLRMLEEECDREINLVNDLLMTQHLNAGTYPLSCTSIDLQHWLAHIAETFQHRVTLNHQKFYLEIGNPLPMIESDLFILNRILVELFNNACKYTPAGHSICLQAHEAETPDHQQTVRMGIRNTGIEIAADEIHRIFETFYRATRQSPYQQYGSGLGLALVKRLVEYLGGAIWAESGGLQVQVFVELPLRLKSSTH